MISDRDEQTKNLSRMHRSELLKMWRQHLQSAPPKHLRKELLAPMLAYRLQEQSHGGLSRRARRKLAEIAGEELPKANQRAAGLAPGTKLLRTWRGELHEVSVTSNGFHYKDSTFNNLSAVARKITGTRWSGPLFFGLRQKEV